MLCMHWVGQQAMQLPGDQPPEPSCIALIICILPYPAAEIQRAVKNFGDLESGIPTQCIVSAMYIHMVAIADIFLSA